MGMALAPGLVSAVQIVVADTDTAIALGSGDVPVLGTPRLLALAEEASVAAIKPSLESGLTSVGTSAVVRHKRPSPVGAEVVVEAELTEVDGRRLTFRFIASHTRPAGSAEGQDAVVGVGTLERMVVARDRFVGGLDL
jgi:fluoroacetyl-CoA thioesterase